MPLSVLKSKKFSLVWSSYTCSAFSTSIVPTVLTLFIIDRTEELTSLGWVLGARTLGFIIGAIFSGVITDHFRHKHILLTSSLLRALATLMIIAGLWLHSIPLICAVILALGVGEGFFRSAYQAVVVDITAENERQAANAASTLSMRLSLTIAPLTATLLYSFCGGFITLFFAILLWSISALVLLPLKEHAQAAPEEPLNIRFFLTRYREGYREALRHRWFMAGLAALSIWLSLSYSAQQLVLPLVSRETYGSNSVIGVALACYSVGAIVASLVLSRWKPRYPGLLAFISLSFYGLVPFALNYAENLWFIYIAYFIGGWGIEAFNIPWFTAIQREVPRSLIGRVSSFDFLVSYAISPLMLAILPALINTLGREHVLIICGALTVAVCLLAILIPGAIFMHEPKQDAVNSARLSPDSEQR